MKNKIPTPFQNKVYQAVAKIPKGQIRTYAQIAQAIGSPQSARAVGNALNKNPFAPKVPCHRVVKSNGEVGGFAGGIKKKIAMLKKEEVKIKNGYVIK